MAANSIKALKDACNKKLDTMECRCVTIKGVKNLSRSDVETALLYAEYAETGRLHELMQPRGSIADLLKAYGII